jgi:peptidoglycan/LPS O-acetylase OafA/YrhL
VCAAVLIWRCVLVFYFKTPLVPYVRWTYIATDARLDSIAFGCLLAVAQNPWCNDAGGWLQRRAGSFALIGCALILLSLIVREPHLRETVRYSLEGIALYPIFYFCVLRTDSAWVHWLSWLPLRWLGWISYSLYLCHEVVLAVFGHIFPVSKPVLAIASLAVSILFAWIMRVLVETPLRKMRSRKKLRVAV